MSLAKTLCFFREVLLEEDEVGGDFAGGKVLPTPLLQSLGAKLRARGESDEGTGTSPDLGCGMATTAAMARDKTRRSCAK